MRLIAGSGRSGTTWIQDALATANGLRPVFEPLHPHVSEIGDRYAHRAIASDHDEPELRQFLEEVCAGRRHVLWTTYRRQVRWLFPPPAEFWSKHDAGRVWRHWGKFLKDFPMLAVAGRRRDPLVKCIRANLMLGWLSRNCGWKVVLVIRHPGAVIESELRGSWNARFALDRFRNDARLKELTFGRYAGLLSRDLKPVEALAARWAIENQWVAEAAASNGVTVVFYERLRTSPEREWERIRRALSLPKVPAMDILERPSQQSSPNKSGARAKEATDPRWIHALTAGHLAMIQGVLDQAEVTLYSMRDPNPNEQAIDAIGKDCASAAS